MCSRKKKDDDTDEDKEKKHQSKMDAKFLSFTTFYYAVSAIYLHFLHGFLHWKSLHLQQRKVNVKKRIAFGNKEHTKSRKSETRFD